MERSKQTWGAMIQAQDRKSHRSAVACKDLRAAVFTKFFDWDVVDCEQSGLLGSPERPILV